MAPMVGAVVLLALTGCSIAPATAHELSGVRSFAENLAATQELVGGDWQVRDDPTGRYCSVPSGGSGESTPALRIGALPTESGESPEPSATAEAVASAWTQWGYAVTQSVSHVSIGEVAEVQASGESGEYLIFRASHNAVTLQGESACNSTP